MSALQAAEAEAADTAEMVAQAVTQAKNMSTPLGIEYAAAPAEEEEDMALMEETHIFLSTGPSLLEAAEADTVEKGETPQTQCPFITDILEKDMDREEGNITKLLKMIDSRVPPLQAVEVDMEKIFHHPEPPSVDLEYASFPTPKPSFCLKIKGGKYTMKVFQIEANICYWDATRKFPSVRSTIGYFPPSVLFVEAPDYVFEGWGYDPVGEGDSKFIKPTPPDGWLYDDKTGTFYQEGSKSLEKSISDLIVNAVNEI